VAPRGRPLELPDSVAQDRSRTRILQDALGIAGFSNGLQLDYGEVRRRLGDIFGAYGFSNQGDRVFRAHGAGSDETRSVAILIQSSGWLRARTFGRYDEPSAIDQQVAAPMLAAASVAAPAAASADPRAAGGGLCTCRMLLAECPFAGATHGSLSVWGTNRGYLVRPIAASATYYAKRETLFHCFLRSMAKPNRRAGCVLLLDYPGSVGAACQRPSTVTCFIDVGRLPAKAEGYHKTSQLRTR
jgi:hypothetical protein